MANQNSYTGVINDLEEQLFAFNPKSQEIYNLIGTLKNYSPVEKPKEVTTVVANNNLDRLLELVFDTDAPVTNLIQFAITYSNQLIKSKDIENLIKRFYPGFDKGLSTPLYKLKEADLIDTFNPTITEENADGSNHHVYYGLKVWFKGKNNIKDEYMSKSLKEFIEFMI